MTAPAPAVAIADGALLAMTHIHKSFGQTRALVGAELVIRPGEVHALAGENGSGKTTLIKILSGVLAADSGGITWQGADVTIANPRQAQRLKISVVFQETLFAAEQTVIDNIYMGMDGVLIRKRGRAAEAEGAARILADLGADSININAPLWALSLAERQIVTIARSAVRPWDLLILDEGTSALDASQRDRLFDYLRAQRQVGKSVLFTSHRMDEIESLADTVSVLRAGSTVLRASVADLSPRRILAAMAGRDMDQAEAVRPDRGERRTALGRPAITAPKPTRPASGETVTIHEGEIFGLAGLEGQGQSDFLKSLAGLAKPAGPGGVIRHGQDGVDHRVRSFSAARKLQIAFVPQDRKHEGLFFSRSTLDNFSVGLLKETSHGGFLAHRRIRRLFEEFVPVVQLLAHNPRNLVGTLSGGNQQKVLLARWLATRPRVLVLSDPMRGVDANTKQELHVLLRGLAEEGLAIVLLSTEVHELLALCDRIAVFHDGAVVSLLDGASATDTDIVAAMFGHTAELRGDDR